MRSSVILTVLLMCTAPSLAFAQDPPPAQPPAPVVQPAPVTPAPQQPATTPAPQTGAAPATTPAAGSNALPVGQAEVDNWDSDKPVPPGYHVESKFRTGTIVGGFVLTGIMWGITALSAYVYHSADQSVDAVGVALGAKPAVTDVTPLYIPVAGPFIQVFTTGGGAFGKIILVTDGLLQVGGAAMVVYGFAVPKVYLSRNATAKNAPTVAIQPTLGGMGIGGTF